MNLWLPNARLIGPQIKLSCRLLITLLPAVFMLAACSRDQGMDEKSNPFYLRGIRLREKSAYAEAAEAFEQCLRVTPQAVSAHLQLGMLYEDHLAEPVTALYHYQIFLQKRPEDENAVVAKSSIERIELELLEKYRIRYHQPATVEQLDAQVAPHDGQERIQALLQDKRFLLVRLRELNRRMQALEATIEASTSEAPTLRHQIPALDQPPKLPEPEETVQRYVVQKGDTLSSIARSMVGSARYWPALLAANREVLEEADSLRPGMNLRIPARQTLDRILHDGR